MFTKEKIREIADQCHKELGFPYNGFLELYTKKIQEEISKQLNDAIADKYDIHSDGLPYVDGLDDAVRIISDLLS